jgi:hypothetical protein
MNPYQNPSIELFGLRIDEPVTAGTDIIVALMLIIGFLKINTKNNQKHVKFYSYSFLVTGIAMIISALVSHAFLYHFGYEAKIYGWIITIIGASFAQFGVLYHVKGIFRPSTNKFLLYFAMTEITAALVLIFFIRSFVFVEVHSAIAMVGMVVVLEWMNYSRTGSKLSLAMVKGVIWATGAVIGHALKINISKWFNYMDLGHVFVAIGFVIMIKGVLNEQKLNLAKQ